MLRDALLENLHRSQLNPLEEAAAYDQLLADFGCTHEELARRIGRSRPQISNTLRLLKLPPPVQRRVAAGVLSAGHARALLGLEDPEAQELLAHRIVAEGLSVRAVEEIVALGVPTPLPSPVARSADRRPRGSPISPARLSDRLETRVRIQMGRTRGKVMIDFATLGRPEPDRRSDRGPDASTGTPRSLTTTDAFLPHLWGIDRVSAPGPARDRARRDRCRRPPRTAAAGTSRSCRVPR